VSSVMQTARRIVRPTLALDTPSTLMRMGRLSRYVPGFRGLNALMRIYQERFQSPHYFEIDDFDGDLQVVAKIPDCIGINLWHRPGQYERAERKIFLAAIHQGDLILDIGANIGIYSLLAAKKGARVVAFEPDDENVELFRYHVDVNGMRDRVGVMPIAAASMRKDIKLFRNPLNSGGTTAFGNTDPMTVPGMPIDELGLENVSVCKLDVEGSESDVILGMQRTIARSPKMRMLVEYNEQFGDGDRLMSLLKRHFTTVRVVGGGAIRPFCNLWCER
jgi:FkbM family methyltransferase